MCQNKSMYNLRGVSHLFKADENEHTGIAWLLVEKKRRWYEIRKHILRSSRSIACENGQQDIKDLSFRLICSSIIHLNNDHMSYLFSSDLVHVTNVHSFLFMLQLFVLFCACYNCWLFSLFFICGKCLV